MKQITALTGLRFFAALHVLLFHFTDSSKFQWPEFISKIISRGTVSVDLFFVLSGFILSYTYIQNGELTKHLRFFWGLRFARIYPVYFVAFVVSIPWAMQIINTTYSKTFFIAGASLTLMQSWFADISTIWNSPSWSLSVEAFFYFLFPFLAPLVFRLSNKAIILLISMPLILSICYPLFGLPEGNLHNPLLRLPEFLAGIGVCKIYFERSCSCRVSGAITFFSVATIVIILGANINMSYPNGMLTPVFALLIYGLATGGGFIGGILSFKPIAFLGAASYSLYIIHCPIVVYCHAIQKIFPVVELDSMGYLFICLVIVFSGSISLFLLVEKPAYAFLRRYFQNINTPRTIKIDPWSGEPK